MPSFSAKTGGGSDIVMVRVHGVNESRMALHKYRKDVEKYAERGIIKAAEWLHQKSLEIAPEDTSEMKNTSRVAVTGKGFSTKATVQYTVWYAIYVHENLEAEHAPPTQAKFLSVPAYRERPRMNQIIWEEINKAKIKRYL